MQPRTLPVAFACIATALVALPAQARAAAPKAATCTLAGWATNDAPVPVLAQPSAKARVIGRLPGPTPGYDWPIDFRITGAANGWIRIEGASDAYNEGEGRAPRPLPKAAGWIPGNVVRFQIQSAHGYAGPDAKSARILDLGDDWATDMASLARLHDCAGEWAEVTLAFDRSRDAKGNLTELPEPHERRRAWFRGICPVMETTCDMASVDRPD